MIILEVLVGLYLFIGFVYAFYILLFGKDPWYLFLINLLGGPLMLSISFYVSYTGKKLPYE